MAWTRQRGGSSGYDAASVDTGHGDATVVAPFRRDTGRAHDSGAGGVGGGASRIKDQGPEGVDEQRRYPGPLTGTQPVKNWGLCAPYHR
jgi:hypothetical protein